MDSRLVKTRMNVEGDRISILPDDLIHKILSFVDIKQAIETSALSSRWRYVWTSMPYLSFSNRDFHTLCKFSKFVKHVLSRRNNQIDVHSVNLTFHGNASQAALRKLLDYAFSHNVQQLNITCFVGKRIKFPLSLFSSQSLKHLSLSGCSHIHFILTPPAWDLPALTTLYLDQVTLCDGVFSNCANLKNLTIMDCRLLGLDIWHPGLSSLTLERGYTYTSVNVITPRLENLAINNWRGIRLICGPNLSFLSYTSILFDPLEISADLLNLEKVDICIMSLSDHRANAHHIMCLLQRVHSVKFLTLSSEIIKYLSSSVELISHQPSPFYNLKSLKIYPYYVEQTQPEVTMCTDVKNYLLDASPGATLTIVSQEEARVVKNVSSARKLMRELQVLLDQWKHNSETNTTRLMQNKAPMEVENQLDTKMNWQFWERMTHNLERGYKNTDRTVSMLREIEGLLGKLPKSHRAKLLVTFSSLCAQAETMMDVMVDHFKIQCDKKPRLNFHELATVL